MSGGATLAPLLALLRWNLNVQVFAANHRAMKSEHRIDNSSNYATSRQQWARTLCRCSVFAIMNRCNRSCAAERGEPCSLSACSALHATSTFRWPFPRFVVLKLNACRSTSLWVLRLKRIASKARSCAKSRAATTSWCSRCQAGNSEVHRSPHDRVNVFGVLNGPNPLRHLYRSVFGVVRMIIAARERYF